MNNNDYDNLVKLSTEIIKRFNNHKYRFIKINSLPVAEDIEFSISISNDYLEIYVEYFDPNCNYFFDVSDFVSDRYEIPLIYLINDEIFEEYLDNLELREINDK